MGGGGLRILGHKKWHVWTRDNIERVERDERLERERVEEEESRQRQREQQVRLEKLQGSSSQREDSFSILAPKVKKEERSTEKEAGASFYRKSGKDPWYSLPKGSSSSSSSSSRLTKRERNDDHSEDPWNDVQEHFRKAERRHRTKSSLPDFANDVVSTKKDDTRSSRSRKKSKKKKGSDTMESLRRERKQREERERRRIKKVIL